jgi:predicted Zn-dependent peptidase
MLMKMRTNRATVAAVLSTFLSLSPASFAAPLPLIGNNTEIRDWSSIHTELLFTTSLLLSDAPIEQEAPASNTSPAATDSTTDSKTSDSLPSPLIPISKDFTLPNGLRVILSEDHHVPIVAFDIVFNVGARNEVRGRSGFAHLFEHMMFQGSTNVAKSEHLKDIEAAGGSANASTRPDFTNYYDKVPSNQAELPLWLESDRMLFLKITPQNFENQLETVKEEKRLRIDNQPYIPASLKFEELLYDNWSNAHPVIGSFEDLDNSNITDIANFFKTYYAPNNAVMAIVGDFQTAKMEQLVTKYFGSIPRGPAAPSVDVSEPIQDHPKYLKVDDPYAQAPAIFMGWKAPARREPDYYPIGIIEYLLSAGTSSRLYQRLIKGDEVALSADAELNERRGPSAFELSAVLKQGHTSEQVREILWQEINKLKDKPVSNLELETAKNQLLRSLFASNSSASLQRTTSRAEILAEYACFYGDPKLFDEDIKAYLAVTADDIQKAAQHLFTTNGVTIVDVAPIPAKAQLPRSSALASHPSNKKATH